MILFCAAYNDYVTFSLLLPALVTACIAATMMGSTGMRERPACCVHGGRIGAGEVQNIADMFQSWGPPQIARSSSLPPSTDITTHYTTQIRNTAFYSAIEVTLY